METGSRVLREEIVNSPVIKRILAAKGMTGANSVALFGATTEARLVAPFLETFRLKVSMIADNNPKLHGTTLDGIQVGPPGSLLEDKSCYVVITSARHHAAIKKQLEDMGLEEHNQFTDYRTIMTQTFF